MKEKLAKHKKWIWIVAAALVVVLLVVLLFSGRGSNSGSTIMTATVTRGDVKTTIVGSGTLAFDTSVNIKLPTALELDEVLVGQGEYVSAGDPLAVANYASLLDNIKEVKDELNSLDRDINNASDSTKTEYVTSYVSGRVKAVYVQKGDNAAEAMRQYGALVVLSIDGKMAVDVTTGRSLAIGDAVTVLLSDGTEKDGEVSAIEDDTATVTLDDNGPRLDEKATVKTQDGATIGTGNLYIHQPLTLMGSGGTVSSVNVSENQYIYSGKSVVVLQDVPASAEYRQLISERMELADTLNILVSAANNDGILTAPYDGTVLSVNVGDLSSADSTSVDQGTAYDLLLGGIASGYGAAYAGRMPTTVSTAARSLPDTPIANLDMLSLIAPVAGAAPVTQLTGLMEYQADIAWTPAHTTFQYGTAYTAGFKLTAKTGYIFEQTFVPALTNATIDPAGVVISPDGRELTFSAQYQKTAESPTIQIPDISITGLDGLSGLANYTGGVSYGTGLTTQSDLLTVAFQIATEDDEMVVSINVDELDILHIEKGQRATMVFDALDGSFEGTIVRLSNVAASSGGVTKYKVDISIERIDSMRAGMNVTVTIDVGLAEDVLTIPVSALQEMGGRVFVYTQYDEKSGVLSGETDVETGLSDGTTVEIVSGLSEGDTVYYNEAASNNWYTMFYGGPDEDE